MRSLTILIVATVAVLAAVPQVSADPLLSKRQFHSNERHHLRADRLRTQSVERARAPLQRKVVIYPDGDVADSVKYAVVSDQIARLGALVRAAEPAK